MSGRGSSRRSRSLSDDAGALPRARPRVDQSSGPCPVSPAPAPQPPDGHRPRRELPGGERIFHRPRARGGAPPDRRRTLRFLRRRARPRLGPGDAVRRLSRLGHRPLLGPHRAPRHRRVLRPDAAPARGDRRDGGPDRVDDGELHEGAGRVDRRRVHRGDDGAPGADDLPHRGRALPPPRARPLGPRGPVEPDRAPADLLHVASDARDGRAALGRPRRAARGAQRDRRRAAADPSAGHARDRARVGARRPRLPGG